MGLRRPPHESWPRRECCRQGTVHYGSMGYAAQDSGGYKMAPSWVNMVQRVQTSHLPDPVDPTPVLQGITVYYTESVGRGELCDSRRPQMEIRAEGTVAGRGNCEWLCAQSCLGSSEAKQRAGRGVAGPAAARFP